MYEITAKALKFYWSPKNGEDSAVNREMIRKIMRNMKLDRIERKGITETRIVEYSYRWIGESPKNSNFCNR
jgi:hypothetical protein